MRHGLGLNKILRTIHTYPTLADANKYALASGAARTPRSACSSGSPGFMPGGAERALDRGQTSRVLTVQTLAAAPPQAIHI